MRVVVDVNILVSALISRRDSNPRRLLEAVLDGRLTVVLSRPLIDEFIEVMSRPKVSRCGVTVDDVLDFVAGLLAVASLVGITGQPRGCDDPDDDAVIETAEVGDARYIITGDSDLLADRVRLILRGSGIFVTVSDFLDRTFEPEDVGRSLDQALAAIAVQAASVLASCRTHLSEAGPCGSQLCHVCRGKTTKEPLSDFVVILRSEEWNAAPTDTGHLIAI